jgi:hypothetical protein
MFNLQLISNPIKFTAFAVVCGVWSRARWGRVRTSARETPVSKKSAKRLLYRSYTTVLGTTFNLLRDRYMSLHTGGKCWWSGTIENLCDIAPGISLVSRSSAVARPMDGLARTRHVLRSNGWFGLDVSPLFLKLKICLAMEFATEVWRSAILEPPRRDCSDN